VLACACGGNSSGKQPDAAPTIDAPPLVACTPRSGMTMSARRIGQVSGSAILATSPPNDGRLFVIEQDGRIRIFDNEQLRPTPFLDINAIVTGGTGSEQGLLGLAFHPKYAFNNYFYVWYTGQSGGNADILARYTASATDPSVADPASGTILLAIPDFASNHNGGMLEFGADGFLYIGTGDGGGGGDPHRNAQAIDRTAASCIASQCDPLLGKILRIDVDNPANGKPYGIPADNPFAAGGGEPEIFMIGVRNPWRWAFDRMTGDMWIGDVGQNLIEELDVLPAGQQAGKNLGWSMWEADSCYRAPCSMAGITFPQYQVTHAQGWAAIIRGQVYRCTCFPDIAGYYFFTDNTAHTLSRAQYDAVGNTVTSTNLPGTWPQGPSSLHADARGELYETTTNGTVYRLEAGP